MSNNLKILAGQIISETNLPKETKIQLLNFIQKEATDSQIKVLLMDGQIVQLDEQAEEIVNDRFKGHKIMQEGALGSMLGILVFSYPVWAQYRKYKASKDKNLKQCGTYEIGMKREVCLTRLKADEAKEMTFMLTKNMADCKKSKNPAECRDQHENKIMASQMKYIAAMEKLKEYQRKNTTKTSQGIEQAYKK